MRIFLLFLSGIVIGIWGIKHYYIEKQPSRDTNVLSYAKDEVKTSNVLSEESSSDTNTVAEINYLIETPIPTITDIPEFTPAPTFTVAPLPTIFNRRTANKVATLPTATVTLKPTPTPTAGLTQAPTVTSTTTPTYTATPTPSPKPVQKYTSQEINGFIDRFAGQYAVDPNVLRHIAVCESGFNPLAISPNGLYAGLYQFSSSAWVNYRTKIGEDTASSLRFDAEEAVQTASYVLSTGRGKIWPNCMP